MKFPSQSGIAIGPILFVVAILAVLAAAIAAGSGSFTGGTTTENAKVMAQTILNSCRDYQAAVQIMTIQNGCDITKLDYTPNTAWPTGSTYTTGDYTGGNGTNLAGNGSCAMFSINGGGMGYKKLPAGAIASNPTGAYSALGGAPSTNMDAFAGYPVFTGADCVPYNGTCGAVGGFGANGSLLMWYPYIEPKTCQQINALLANQLTYTDEFYVIGGTQIQYSLFAGTQMRNIGDFAGANYELNGVGYPEYVSEGCATDQSSNNSNSAYIYMCTLMIR